MLIRNFKSDKLSLLDIGARGGIAWPWDTVQRDMLNVILVEPDPIEAKILEDQKHGCVLPYALWNEETELTLNINHSPGTSPVFEANMLFLQQFEDAQRHKVKEKIIIKTKTVDALVNTTMVYGFLDYASAIVNTSFSKDYLDKKERESIIKCIDKASNDFYPFKNGSRILHRVFHVLTYSFKPTYEGWANGDPHIVSKKKSFFWF